jgi:selenocysteine lyase/cysteine desulfurase
MGFLWGKPEILESMPPFLGKDYISQREFHPCERYSFIVCAGTTDLG